jgi:diguanylate cyclase (GGDEF)-like protein/PAS domain S-box-containing protein
LTALSIFAASVSIAVVLFFYFATKIITAQHSGSLVNLLTIIFAACMSILTAIFVSFIVLLVKKYLIPSIKDNLEAKAKFESIAQSVGEGIMTLNKDGIITYINSKGAAILGYTEAELIGCNAHETIHYETKDGRFVPACECETLKQVSKNGSYSSEDDIYIQKNKTKIDVSYIATPFIVAGHNEGAIVVFSDISEKKLNMKKLLLSDAIVKNIKEGVIVTDKHSNIIFANQFFETITGYKTDEIIGKKPSLLKSGMHNVNFYENMWLKLLRDESWQGEIWNRKKDGTVYAERLNMCVVSDIFDATEKYYVAVFSDITDRKILESELIKDRELLQEQATHDSLTKLFNRRKMEETLSLEIERYKRCSAPLSIVMFDIDDFKQINDTFGHQVGDITLKQLSVLLKNTIRKIDFAARWGGEEFIVLAPQTDMQGVLALAENLRKTIENSEFACTKKVTCSFGATEFTDDDTVDSLLKRVDDALYLSKKDGKNKVTLI